MGLKSILLVGIFIATISCTEIEPVQNKVNTCSFDDLVKSKDDAKALIIGRWNWIETTYTRRGAGISTETPQSTNKTLTFEFSTTSVAVIENDNRTEDLYTIEFEDESTSNGLMVKFLKSTGEQKSFSLLFLSTSGQCLRLVNSYNDVGGDLTLARAN